MRTQASITTDNVNERYAHGILLAGLTALFMGVGFLIGGTGGMAIAFVIAAA
jgi:hypothetical protein